mgnify:CR=1 FL=1
MTKKQFLKLLNKKLWSLPKTEREERLNFYDEIIEDKIEEGLTEEDAVGEIGSIDEVAKQILGENSIISQAKETLSKTNALKTKYVVLLIISFPIWFPLLASLLSVAITLFVSFWAITISLWAIFGSLCITSPALIILGIFFNYTANPYITLSLIGIAIVCAGLAILFYYLIKATTNLSILITKNICNVIKNSNTIDEIKSDDALINLEILMNMELILLLAQMVLVLIILWICLRRCI